MEEFTLEPRFLGGPLITEVAKNWIELSGIDARGVPTGIKVLGIWFARHIATIKKNPRAAGCEQATDTVYETIEQRASPWIGRKSICDQSKVSGVQALRQDGPRRSRNRD